MSGVPKMPGPFFWWSMAAELVVLVIGEILRRTTPEPSSKNK